MIRDRPILRWFIRVLMPAEWKYYTVINVWAQTTSGKYEKTEVSGLTVSDAVIRLARIHALPGHGSDEHWDSNRGGR